MAPSPTNPDPRLLSNGRIIPTETYADQPYIVQTDDGAWLCCVTTGPGAEGARGQHVTTIRSNDQGQTWSKPVPVEPPESPENSYAVMLKAPNGRIFIFYNHNTDNVREVKRHDGKGVYQRVDSLGHFVFRYSDDHGRSWSAKRFPIPVREFACDRANVYGGTLRFFWNVGRPFIHKEAAFVPLIKVGKMGEGFFAQSEGALLKSANLLTERDPSKIEWETLPDGDIGLRTPPGGGPISEEQSYCVLGDGSFYCVYRSIDGHPVETYSRDGGHTWATPRYKRYADGRLMKHPRAANFAWHCHNGKYLYWFHNHGGRDYEDRNPVWLSGGIEADSPEGRVILWSQPEVALYSDDPFIRISYPDLVEENGKYYLTETQKNVARVHEIDAGLLGGMWETVGAGVDGHLAEPRFVEVRDQALPHFLEQDHQRPDSGTKDLRTGFTVECWLRLDSLSAGQVLADSRTPQGRGFALQTTDRGTIELVLNDGRSECRWDCDPVIEAGKFHHVVAIVDGGPKIINFVVDGKLCDGGEWRQFGWGRFSSHLRHANGEPTLRIGSSVRSMRIHGRSLRTFEAVAVFRQCEHRN